MNAHFVTCIIGYARIYEIKLLYSRAINEIAKRKSIYEKRDVVLVRARCVSRYYELDAHFVRLGVDCMTQSPIIG